MRPAAAFLLILSLSGCDGMARIFGADMPDGFVRFTPSSDYLPWWRQIEECSGRRGSMHRVEWFFYPNTARIPGTDDIGFRRDPGHDIFFADIDEANFTRPFREMPSVVRHEMLHDLLDSDGHDPEYFERRCGALVTH